MGGSAFLGVYWPESVASVLAVIGLVVAAAGVLLLLIAGVSLGPAFSPLPHPTEGGRLTERGIYRLVRHPIYGAVILIALGWSLAESPLGLIPTAALVVLLDLKARVEEDWLEQRYPEYVRYREATPRRFVPWIY